ncbi:hypothetical protein Phou_079650 [Phytohabitans houttuyneae]|uniref:Alcohol dehydrogenase-like C-terminal domain-containing protein n=1 Tax=Phytohabitans houttuyneae TaxID=1076126 RepID=A0A6V8KT64_9ACTN|nr:hypothetical protein Phou_079650 [Phytohabitans houttuyneae]
MAVWGAGAVGQMAARAAMLLGAARVIVIDRFDYRLAMAERHIGAETINYTGTSVEAELRERTGGRGPDVCIEAVGMEAHHTGPQHVYDQVKQQLRLQQDRPTAVREAIHACRKAGSVFVLGVFSGMVDKFPLGALMNKGLTLRSAQMHGQRYIPMLLDRMQRDELITEHLATHVLPSTKGQPATNCSKTNKTTASARCSRPRSLTQRGFVGWRLSSSRARRPAFRGRCTGLCGAARWGGCCAPRMRSRSGCCT